jgi:hypothetical protein
MMKAYVCECFIDMSGLFSPTRARAHVRTRIVLPGCGAALYADWQRSIMRELAGIPLVRLDNQETAPVSQTDLPLGDKTITWESVYQLGSGLAAPPLQSIAEGCGTLGRER